MVVTIGTFFFITPTHCYLDIPPEAKMTAVEIILYHGYPVQVFHAQTTDGYILELHRIPFGKNNSSTKRKYNRPVFLQHGLLGSSADWVENLPNESFDAMFNVVLNETKQSSLYYVGFSQGTLIMFAKLSQDPDFSSKSRLVVYIAGEGGTSVMNIIHWIQMVNSGKMQAYNYDSLEENQIHYGQDSPPIYNISSIDVPIYLYWSKNDWLADAADIENSLLSVLPNSSIKGRNQLKDFNHLDFIWGLRVPAEIYHPVISIINKENDRRIA
ncbi:unnamed protein product [Onchocerca ochengi]|uniref:Abhydro_lipase domain-containing protein n=1 Tax=Onchocerca ochengi TaxID=42157 RepID=A0A182DZU7_ONCOC|nr:unnamed protein product [Onchocerca ochengi]VDK63702.1 unnamed protein product [Onchocerca ochengi]